MLNVVDIQLFVSYSHYVEDIKLVETWLQGSEEVDRRRDAFEFWSGGSPLRQLICDRVLEGVDVNPHVGLIAVQPHVEIADVPLNTSPLVSSNSFSEVVIVDRTNER